MTQNHIVPRFSIEDSKQLCTSWAVIPLINKTTQWERVHAHYIKHCKSSISRSVNQLRGHSDILSRSLKRWHDALEEAKRKKETTHSPVDIEILAQCAYKGVDDEATNSRRHPFKDQTLYETVCKYNQWNLQLQDQSTPSKKSRSPSNSLGKSKRKRSIKEDHSDSESSIISDNWEDSDSSADDECVYICNSDSDEDVDPSSDTDKQISEKLIEAKLLKARTYKILASNKALITDIKIMNQDDGPRSKKRVFCYYAK